MRKCKHCGQFEAGRIFPCHSLNEHQFEHYDNKVDQLESDLKTAHEMIREFRKELEFYGNGGNFNLDLWEHPELGHFTGKRARAVLQKWQGKL